MEKWKNLISSKITNFIKMLEGIAEEIYEDRDQIYTGSEYGSLYTDHHSIPRPNEKSIRTDIDKLGFPPDIVNIADSIYQDMDLGTKRGKRRKMLIFYCVFTAYNQENITVDPIWLANICGLERSNISKALSMCSPVLIGTETPAVKFTTSKSYIPVYFNKLREWINFPDTAIQEIYDISDEILERDPTLNDEKPQTVAAAILVHYMKMHGYIIDKEKYKTIFKRSDMTINKIKKRIVAAYNL